MAAQSAYTRTGIDAETQTAWGEFTDGRLHVVVANRAPLPAAARAAKGAAAQKAGAPRLAATELPRAPKARVLHSFGPNFSGQTVVTDLSAWLGAGGWDVRAGQEGDARLSTLRTVAGDGYFYFNSHGGAGGEVLYEGSSQAVYSLQSSTLVSATLEAMPDVQDDLANRRLTYFTAHNGETLRFAGIEIDDWDTRYGITAAFVERYWRFEADSVVVLNACSSARPGAKWADAFIFACHKVGAAVVLGWTNTVSSDGAFSAPCYFTDRLLGANAYEPESPKQRAFPWNEVLADMQRKGVSTDAVSGAVFVARPRGAAVQALDPGLHHVEVDEFTDQARLVGDFGSVRGRVTIEGVERPIVSWAADRIVCELPRSGPGSCGPVQVAVGERKSNTRWITEWRTPLTLRWADPGRPGLVVDGSCVLRHRADVGTVREHAGEAIREVVRYANPARDVALTLTGHGSWYDAGGHCTTTWSGSTTFPAHTEDGSLVLWSMLKADSLTRTGAFGLALGAAAGGTFTEAGCQAPALFAVAFGLMDGVTDFVRDTDLGQIPVPLPSAKFRFADDWSIVGNTIQDDGITVTWGSAAAHFPPLADDVV
jgi:hypothetical protein